LASWAPFTFIGVEINKLCANDSKNGLPLRRLSNDVRNTEIEDHEESGDSLAGIYLGILNLFTTLPQFIGTFMSMIVFSIFEPGLTPDSAKGVQSKDRPNAIAICLFVGAFCALGAAYATSRLRRLI